MWNFTPKIKKIDTSMTSSVYVETWIALIIARLATDNSLSIIGDLYTMSESTTLVIVQECCKAIKIYLLPIVINKIIPNKLR